MLFMTKKSEGNKFGMYWYFLKSYLLTAADDNNLITTVEYKPLTDF